MEQVQKTEKTERDRLMIRFHGEAIDGGTLQKLTTMLRQRVPSFINLEQQPVFTGIQDKYHRILTDRAQSLFNACVLALELGKLGPKQRQQIQKDLQDKFERFKKNISAHDLALNQQYLSWFTRSLLDALDNAYGNSANSLQLLQKAESYTTLEHGAASIATISSVVGQYVIQVEETVPSLTNPLLQDYENIKRGEKIPEWYNRLDPLQKELLRNALDKADNVQEFFRTCPSTLREIPIPANLRHHHLIIVDANDFTVKEQYTQIRASNVASRSAAVEDRSYHTQSNMNAVMAQQPEKTFVLFQTLISPHWITSAMGKPDTKLQADMVEVMRDMTNQMQSAKEQINSPQKQMVITNHPLNLIGKIVASTPNDELINFVVQHTTSDSMAAKALALYIDPKYPHKSNLMMASLEQIMVEQAGGLVHSACMSGKDRNGILLLHTDALRVYFDTHQKFPVTQDEKAEFNKVFVEIFKTRHQQEAAGQNTLGCCGIKEIESVLPNDLKAAINKDSDAKKILKDSHTLAKTNNIDEIISAAPKAPAVDVQPEKSLESAQSVLREIAEITKQDQFWIDQGVSLTFGKKMPDSIKVIKKEMERVPPQVESLSKVIAIAEEAYNKVSKTRSESTQAFLKILSEYASKPVDQQLTKKLQDFQKTHMSARVEKAAESKPNAPNL